MLVGTYVHPAAVKEGEASAGLPQRLDNLVHTGHADLGHGPTVADRARRASMPSHAHLAPGRVGGRWERRGMEVNVHHLPPDLSEFLVQMCTGRRPQTSARYIRVLGHLGRFAAEVELDVVARPLGTDCATLLGCEREFGRGGAFWRIFGYDELVCCLPGFIEGEWLLPQRADARTQVSLTARLLPWLRRRGIIDMSLCACAYWDAEYAVKKARARLDGSRT